MRRVIRLKLLPLAPLVLLAVTIHATPATSCVASVGPQTENAKAHCDGRREKTEPSPAPKPDPAGKSEGGGGGGGGRGSGNMPVSSPKMPSLI